MPVIEVGKMLRPDYLKNLQYLRGILPNVARTAVIFNGETLGSVINIRDIASIGVYPFDIIL